MTATDELLRFVDARLRNYPNGISRGVLSDAQLASSKLTEDMRLKILVNRGDELEHSELIEAIVTKGLKLSRNEVEVIEIDSELSPDLQSKLKNGSRAIACLGLPFSEQIDLKNVCVSYSLKEISNEIDKKRGFWKELQKFMLL